VPGGGLPRLATWLAACLALCAGMLVTAGPSALAQPSSRAEIQAASLRGPIGLDDWRDLNQLPVNTVGAQTRQFSSFDRSGGNDDGFSVKYTCLRQDSRGCLLAQDTGAGEIDSMAFDGNSDYRGNIIVILDGKTVLDAPLTDVVNGKLGAPFVYPLVAPYTISGGNYIYVPMTYTKSMEVYTSNAVANNFYQVGYRHFASADGVTTFDPTADSASDIVATLKAAGTKDPKAPLPGATTQNVPVQLAPGQQATLASLHGPGEISAFRLSVPSLLGMTQPPQEVTLGGRGFNAGGSSQFTVKINPDNDGVRLVRTFDGNVGNQVADVSVDGQPAGRWTPEPEQWGLWIPETLDLPASLTQGKSQITIKNTFMSSASGFKEHGYHSFVSSASDFNEYGYQALSDVGGQWTQTDRFDLGPGNTAQEQAHGYTITNGNFDGTNARETLPSTTDPATVAATDDIMANAKIEISFDGQQTVDVPLGQFFGTGLGKWQIRSLFDGVDGGQGGWLSSWWPMPYRDRATITLVNGSQHTIGQATAQITAAPDPEWAAELGPDGHAGYFHATDHDGPSTPGRDVNWLTASGTGKLAGVFMTMQGSNPAQGRGFMEGDQHTWLDGSRTPQINGIGTESIGLGGYYFNHGMFTGALSGDPWQQGAQDGCLANCTGEYRLWVPDAETFTSGIVAGQEHGGTDDAPVNDETIAFWYGRPQVTGVQTDSLTMRDSSSEAAHDVTAANSCIPQQLTGTFEGDDGPYEGLAPTNYTAAEQQLSSPVSFTLRIDPANQGVILGRTSDQNLGYQAADVYVDGTYAGEWEQPLANPYHRWLDDSFQIPASLTFGHPELNIKLVHVPGSFAWNAAGYRAVSLIGAQSASTATSAPATSAPATQPAASSSPAAASSCGAVISSVSPSVASPGQQVTISGSGFGATQGSGYVDFTDRDTSWDGPQQSDSYWWLGAGTGASAPLTIDSWSDTKITFTVPASSGQTELGPGTLGAVSVVSSSGDAAVSTSASVAITPPSYDGHLLCMLGYTPQEIWHADQGYGCALDNGYKYNGWPATAPTTYCWADAQSLQFHVTVPVGVSGTLRLFLVDADNYQGGRDETVSVDGHNVGTFSGFQQGKWIEANITAADTADGRINVEVNNARQGSNVAVSEVAF
jgi:hypothetical protein